MGKVRFTDLEASILYCIPQPPSDLSSIIQCYAFIERTFPPSYEELSDCLGKALNVGILENVDGKFLVDQKWYQQIHLADDSAANEIESSLEFAEFLLATEWEEKQDTRFTLDRKQYDAAVKRSRRKGFF